MCFSTKSYKIPRPCWLLISLGVFVLLFGVAHTAEADDQMSRSTQAYGQFDCNACSAFTVENDVVTQSLMPNEGDVCDICHTLNQSENEEDANDPANLEQRLHAVLTDVIAFNNQNPYFADDSRQEFIVENLNLTRNALERGDFAAAIGFINTANNLLGELRIEAEHTSFIDGSRPVQHWLIASAQTDTKSRTMNEILFSSRVNSLLDSDSQEFSVAIKQLVGFTIRTEHVLHRRVPLSDEEGNILLLYVANSRQRSPSFECAISVLFYWQAEALWLTPLNTPIQSQLQAFAV